MQLFPHLHLLVPSSTTGILLEARLYLAQPPPPPKEDTEGRSPSILPISISSGSRPTRYDQLSSEITQALRELHIDRLVTAAHPWGKLGGNMLDPVIAESLLSCVFHSVAHVEPIGSEESHTAVITYNVRGVGKSQGRSPLITVGKDPDDFAAVEAAALRLLGGGSNGALQVHRMGYSWGCLSAVLAPPPRDHPVISYLLISPAVSAFKALAYLTQSFHAGLKTLMPAEKQEDRQHVWMIYGTADQFTGVGAFRACIDEFASRGIRGWEVQAADHFFRSEAEGEALEKGISASWSAVTQTESKGLDPAVEGDSDPAGMAAAQ